MTASLMIRCPSLAVDVSAPRVGGLPLTSLSRGDGRRCPHLPFHVAWAKKTLMLALQIFVRFDAPEFGCELFKLGSALRDDHADRLVGPEFLLHEFWGGFST